MDFESKYNIDAKIQFNPMEIIDFPELIKGCAKQWQNLALCQVNDSVIRLGVIKGEFHWHKHDREDEFFYVIEGQLLIDLEGRTVGLGPCQGFVVPMGVTHRTRAPKRTAIMMVEGSTVTPTGD
ncbi:MAG: cupin domain-containing protein [Candidatus Thorarchaeota archaeon]|nr:MAG: cupin domain-containing protein [Candidatus Thorarchaeota archaeon]